MSDANDYADDDRHSPVLEWVIAIGLPFVCLLILLATRFAEEWLPKLTR